MAWSDMTMNYIYTYVYICNFLLHKSPSPTLAGTIYPEHCYELCSWKCNSREAKWRWFWVSIMEELMVSGY